MRNILMTLFFYVLTITISAQDSIKMQKPRVMVVPEEAYCINSGMSKTSATGEKVADYNLALRNDNVLDAISCIENQMAGYGFQLTNLQQSLDALKEEAALDNTLTAKDDGMIVEDDLDKLTRVANADILVKISPKFSNFGPQRRLEFRISSIDCASKKALQAFGPVTKTSAGATTQLINAAISDNIETFAMGLLTHFNNIKKNGREGSIIIKVSDTCPLNLESMVTYKGAEGELADLIEMWLSENSVNGAYSGAKTSRVNMKFDQVHIPLQGKSVFGRQISLSMESFVKTGLVQLLNEYDISVSTHAVGIGRVYLTLGGK